MGAQHPSVIVTAGSAHPHIPSRWDFCAKLAILYLYLVVVALVERRCVYTVRAKLFSVRVIPPPW